MEKEEMRKLLLVAVSVGVFLLVTVTAAIIILTPKVPVQEAAISSSRPYPAGRVQPAADNRISVPAQPEIAQVSDNAIIENNRESLAVVPVDSRNEDSLIIQIPRPTTAAVPDAVSVPPPAAARPAATVAQRPPAASTTQAPAARPAAPRPAAPAARPATPARTINDFWVQTGAFSARVRAEDARETLASKGITSIIENREINGRTWYRVRLGPYTSEREATYWLALVKTINGFEESQVRQTTRQQ
jgi:DedD protein